ncbi:MAG TPA: molecular chaperone TorD family protein [Thermodesulfovibrionales bacterium]|nr:molecular chaperone TorD family protein [Thermodesulfovibrionales bacterium]
MDGDDIDERASLYRLFSSLFVKEPDEELLVSMKSMFKMAFDDTEREIREDFGYLFLGHAGHLQPYESLYNYALGDRPRLWGTATGEVQGLYHSAGVMIDEEIDLIPDHVSAEFLFMSYLIENGLREEQRRFLDDHLFAWIPAYCDEMQKHARTTFYREVAGLLKEFVSSDSQELDDSGGE